MVLEVDNIELVFDHKYILNGIYLKAKKGRVTGILGRNGCGKSSLLKIIFGHIKPNNKLIRIDNKPILKPLYLLGKTKYLSQKNTIPNSLSLGILFKIFRTNWAGFITHFPSFEKYKNQKIGTLSGGEKRVVETYLILMSPGEIILLDEPFSNIAPLFIETFIKLIQEEKKNKVIIVTDHMYQYIQEVSDDLYLIINNTSRLINEPKELVDYGYLTSL